MIVVDGQDDEDGLETRLFGEFSLSARVLPSNVCVFDLQPFKIVSFNLSVLSFGLLSCFLCDGVSLASVLVVLGHCGKLGMSSRC